MNPDKRAFEFSEGTSNKFWEIWLEGSKVLTRYGRIGSTGQQTVKDESTSDSAQKLFEKLIREKARKGYVERSGGSAKPPASAVKASAKVQEPASPAGRPPASKKGQLTRESIQGLKVYLRGSFALGAAKDLERALKGLGAKVTKFWDEADVVFFADDIGWKPTVKGRVANEKALAALLGDGVQAVAEARSKAEAPKAQKLGLHPADAAFREAFWKNPKDLTALRVWADSLVERGDVRGEYLQLCNLENSTEAQQEQESALRKRLGGQLVGPARPFLRTYELGGNGLVRWAVTEAPRVVEGFDLIAALNPRLSLGISSLRTKTMAVIAELVKHPLREIFHLQLDSNGLSDKAGAALAVGLEGVKRLNLDHNDLTGAGLLAMAPHLNELEYLSLNCSMAQSRGGNGAPFVAGWVDALVQPGLFPQLKVLRVRGGYSLPRPTPADQKRLEARGVEVVDTYDVMSGE